MRTEVDKHTQRIKENSVAFQNSSQFRSHPDCLLLYADTEPSGNVAIHVFDGYHTLEALLLEQLQHPVEIDHPLTHPFDTLARSCLAGMHMSGKPMKRLDAGLLESRVDELIIIQGHA